MIRFLDRADIGKTKITKEGYMLATARIARTGVQVYRAHQLGDVAIAAGFDADDMVRVYRSPDEVFHTDSLMSLTRVPVTLDHPDEQVDSDNWKDLAIGDVGDRVARDGDWLVVNPMLKDSAGITAANTTHKEISMGYEAEIIVARDGVDADFEMVNIRHNHLAAVPKGRAGSQARFGDAAEWGVSPITVTDQKETKMTVELKTVVLGDAQVEVLAKDAATVAAILKDHKTAIDAKDTEIGTLTAKLATAEAKILSDADIDALVSARVELNTKRDAVKAKFGDEAIKDASDAMIEGMYRVIGKAEKTSRVADALKDGAVVVDDADARIAAAQKKFLNPEVK